MAYKMFQRKRNLRRTFTEDRVVGRCGLCGLVDSMRFFDVDHIVPKCRGGPDQPWNLWTLCLRDHRAKSLMEASFLRRLKGEHYCWSCGCVSSKYFAVDAFWCPACVDSEHRFDAARSLMIEMVKKSIEI